MRAQSTGQCNFLYALSNIQHDSRAAPAPAPLLVATHQVLGGALLQLGVHEPLVAVEQLAHVARQRRVGWL